MAVQSDHHRVWPAPLKHQRQLRIWKRHRLITRPPDNTQAALAELVYEASLADNIAAPGAYGGQVASGSPASCEDVVGRRLDAMSRQPGGNSCPGLAAVVGHIHHPLARPLELLNRGQGAWNRMRAVEKDTVLVQHKRVVVASVQALPSCGRGCMCHAAMPLLRLRQALCPVLRMNFPLRCERNPAGLTQESLTKYSEGSPLR